MMNLPPQVDLALKKLAASGYEAYLVGGAVRDFVRSGAQTSDWDLATNALPDEVQAVFSGYSLIKTGVMHGTVTVVLDGVPLEITTYRVDGGYTDHRHPDTVRFTRTLREDLARRDFTINALAYHPQTGVVDLVGGLADLAAGIIRCVGEPVRRFQEDGLRMLRALRFASVYEFQIEAATAAAIHSCKALLCDIAPERVQLELTKLLCGKGAGAVLRDFSDVLAVCIPELSPMFGFDQHNPHHDKDVWAHTIAVVEHIPPEPVLRWAALLHDAGKPACFSMQADGLGHFYGHAAESRAIAQGVLERLRFDNASKARIDRLVRYHDMPITADEKLLKRLLSKHGEAAARELLALHRADALGQSPACAGRVQIFDAASRILDELLSAQTCFSLKDLALNGHDVMALGFQGRDIGRALEACLEAVLDERVCNDKASLLSYLRAQAPDIQRVQSQ